MNDPETILGDDWVLVEADDEDLARGMGVRVRTHRRLYENGALRERVRSATGVDSLWWALFSNELELRPSPPARLLDPIRTRIAVPEARRRLTETLREQGFEDVDYRGTREVALGTGLRGDMLEFRAALVTPDGSVPVDAMLVAWSDEGLFLAGGIYPSAPDRRVPGADEPLFEPPGTYRDRTLELIRALV